MADVSTIPMYPDAAQRIKNIIMQAAGSVFHNGSTIFLGLPDKFMPSNSAFPLCVVDKVTGTYQVGPTTGDDITEVVYVRVMVDAKTGFGAPDADNTVKRQLQTFIEGRDPTTGYLLPTSIMYALRSNLTIGSQAVPGLVTINQKINVSYNEGHYKDMPETREAIIEITMYERQMILSRETPPSP